MVDHWIASCGKFNRHRAFKRCCYPYCHILKHFLQTLNSIRLQRPERMHVVSVTLLWKRVDLIVPPKDTVSGITLKALPPCT